MWLRGAPGEPFLVGWDWRCWKAMFILQVRLPHTACDLVFFFFLGRVSPRTWTSLRFLLPYCANPAQTLTWSLSTWVTLAGNFTFPAPPCSVEPEGIQAQLCIAHAGNPQRDVLWSCMKSYRGSYTCGVFQDCGSPRFWQGHIHTVARIYSVLC